MKSCNALNQSCLLCEELSCTDKTSDLLCTTSLEVSHCNQLRAFPRHCLVWGSTWMKSDGTAPLPPAQYRRALRVLMASYREVLVKSHILFAGPHPVTWARVPVSWNKKQGIMITKSIWSHCGLGLESDSCLDFWKPKGNLPRFSRILEEGY